MNRSYFTLPVLLCTIAITFVQIPDYKYGAVPKEQLLMEQYEKDTTARAVVLYEKSKGLNAYL